MTQNRLESLVMISVGKKNVLEKRNIQDYTDKFKEKKKKNEFTNI